MHDNVLYKENSLVHIAQQKGRESDELLWRCQFAAHEMGKEIFKQTKIWTYKILIFWMGGDKE